jgi:hypothetical protein
MFKVYFMFYLLNKKKRAKEKRNDIMNVTVEWFWT